MFLLSGCCGLEFMSFEARDIPVVAVIYSFHYQGFNTMLVPSRHYTDPHTHSGMRYTLVEACDCARLWLDCGAKQLSFFFLLFF